MKNISGFLLVFLAIGSICDFSEGQQVWELQFSAPNHVYAHKHSAIGCAAYCGRFLAGGTPNNIADPLPPGVDIPVAAGFEMILMTPEGAVEQIVYEGTGTLVNEGAANPGFLSGTVAPNDEWRIGTSYDIYAISPNYNESGDRTFHVVAENQEGLDDFLELLGILLGGIF